MLSHFLNVFFSFYPLGSLTYGFNVFFNMTLMGLVSKNCHYLNCEFPFLHFDLPCVWTVPHKSTFNEVLSLRAVPRLSCYITFSSVQSKPEAGLPPSVFRGSFFSCHLTDVPKITCNKSDCPDPSGPHGGEAAAVSAQQRLITHRHLCLCQYNAI